MPATPFARAEARLAAAMHRHMANAVLRLPGGAEVAGMLRDSPREAYVGPGMDTREVEFEAPASAVLGVTDWYAHFFGNANEGEAVTLVYQGVESPRRIGRRLPANVHLNSVCVTLTQAQ